MRAAFGRFPMAEARLSAAIAAYANAPLYLLRCRSWYIIVNRRPSVDPTRDTGKALIWLGKSVLAGVPTLRKRSVQRSTGSNLIATPVGGFIQFAGDLDGSLTAPLAPRRGQSWEALDH